VDGQCDKRVTIVGYQLITLTVGICVQHGCQEELSRGSVSGSADLYTPDALPVSQ